MVVKSEITASAIHADRIRRFSVILYASLYELHVGSSFFCVFEGCVDAKENNEFMVVCVLV